MATNYLISSTNGTDYTTAIAKDGGTETETLDGLAADGQGEIKTIMIKSADNRAWQVEVLDTGSLPLYIQSFSENDGTLHSGNYYYCASVAFPIPNFTPTRTVTVGIRNNSSIAKVANSTFVLTVAIEK